MKNKWMMGILFALVVVILTGCSDKEQAEGDTETKKLEELSVMLDWYPNAVHSAFYVAQEKGYFEEQGLDVKIEMPADTNDPLKLAATGKVDLAISYPHQTILSRAEGIPVVSVAALARHSLGAIMMKEEAGIKSPKDLEGKNLGYPSSILTEAIVKTIVEKDGGDFDKVTMTDVGWDIIPALATDNVDAIAGALINHEYVLLENEGYAMDYLNLTEYGIPDYYELVLVAGEDTYKEKQEAIEKFWLAVTKGQEFVKNNPEEGLQILLDHENDSFALDETVETKSLEILLPLMEDEGLPFGYQEQENWQQASDWLYDTGIIETPVDTQDIVKNIVSR